MRKHLMTLKSLLLYMLNIGVIKGFFTFFRMKLQKQGVIKFLYKGVHIILRAKTSDIPTFTQVFANEEYDFKLNFTPRTIIDAGANIGLAAVFFANKFPNAQIFSIEPEQLNFEQLKLNVQEYENVIPLQKALSSVGEMELQVVDRGYGNWGFMTETVNSGKGQSNVVKTITIHDILNEYKLATLDIVKIDIEGFEKEVFEKNTEKWLPYTKCLIIELHDWMKKGCSKSVFGAISKFNFSYSQKGENIVFMNEDVKIDSVS